MRFPILGVLALVLFHALEVPAAWTNPVPTNAVSVAVMSDTNGNVQAPTSLTFVRATLTQLSLGGELIDQWSDISALNGDYANAVANGGTTPASPYGQVTISKSGQTITLKGLVKGQNGIVATNDANGTIYLDGGSTNSVDTFFPRSGTAGVGRIYFTAQASPNNYTYLDLKNTNSGAVSWDGTNLYLGAITTAVGTATNTLLFEGQPAAYYRNMGNVTNFAAFEDGGLVDANVTAIDGGTNVVLSVVTVTNAGIVYRVARLSASPGSASNGLLYGDNVWFGSNSFARTLIVPYLNVTGDGNARSGSGAVVGGGTNNTASGTSATVGGGVNNLASGLYSTVPGGEQNTAAGSWSLAAGHLAQATGSRSAVFGEYAAVSSQKVFFVGWGDAATNQAVATLDVPGLEVAGKIKAAVGFVGDGSGLTNITVSATVTNAVTGVTWQEANTNGAYVQGGTNIIVTFKTNYSATAGGSGTFTNMGIDGSNFTTAAWINPGSNVSFRMTATGAFIDVTGAGSVAITNETDPIATNWINNYGVASQSNNSFAAQTTQLLYAAVARDITATNQLLVDRNQSNVIPFSIKQNGTNVFLASGYGTMNMALSHRSRIGTSGSGLAKADNVPGSADIALNWVPNGTNSISLNVQSVTNAGIAIQPRLLNIAYDAASVNQTYFWFNPDFYGMGQFIVSATNGDALMNLWTSNNATRIGSAANVNTNASLIVVTNAAHATRAMAVFGETYAEGLIRSGIRIIGTLTGGTCTVTFSPGIREGRTNYVPMLTYSGDTSAITNPLGFSARATNSFTVTGTGTATFEGFLIGF